MTIELSYVCRKIPVVPGVLLFTLLVGCVSDSGVLSKLNLKDPRSTDPFEVVNCLFPGEIRQLGTQMTYVTPRRPARVTAEDCAMGGGEYVAFDRADYKTALNVWMAEAEKGDADAQYYVGVLYEKGAEGQPDYATAAEWYQKAAERENRRAAINLGRLYEKGLGVTKNETVARKWYAKANETVGAAEREGVLTSPLGESAQQELADTRARLAEQIGLLEDDRQKLAQAKKQPIEPASGQSAADIVARQERTVQDRQKEIELLKGRVTSLKEATQRQPQVTGGQGPSIQIIDPLLVITRGIRKEEGRIPLVILRGQPYRLTGRVVADGGIRTLEANGTRISFDEQGLFVLPLESLKGATKGVPVDILAVDQQGKRGERRLIVSYGEGMEQPTPGLRPTGRYHALVIGNDHYGSQWMPLSTPVADAKAMSKILQDRYGFQVTTLTDATYEQILKALNDYKKTLSNQDKLLVYYAGHGYLEPRIDRGYWIPVDAEWHDNTKWIDFPKVTDLLELIKAQQILVVADSCFAGKLTRSAIARMNSDLDEQTRESVLQSMTQKKIRTALTSGGAKPVLDEGGGGHSVFATALLGVLSENRDTLETERLFWAVQARITRAAQSMKFEQIPTYGPIHMAGHEGFGDFVFVPTGKRP